MPLVADASVAVKWIVSEPHSAAALELLENNDVVVPDFLLAEVRNALITRVRRKLTSTAEARTSEAEFALLPLIVVPARERLAHAFDLALMLEHPVYDCIYLALAIERGLPLVTADQRMFQLAERLPELEKNIMLLA